MNFCRDSHSSRSFMISIASLLLILSAAITGFAQTTPQRGPADTVREFYKTMREKKYREAFALSIYRSAIEGLTATEFEELRPDFEKMAEAFPEKVDVSGEQISGDVATVFIKFASPEKPPEPEPVTLMREGGVWIVGDRDNYEVVRKAGKQFFFEARIQTHHDEAQSILRRISIAQLAYSTQHNGLFTDLPGLITAGLVPKDIATPETTGYKFHVKLAKDAKSWTAGAEPVQYGRSGRLSFLLDPTGIRSGDVGGKPLVLPEEKNRNEFPGKRSLIAEGGIVLYAFSLSPDTCRSTASSRC